MEYMPAYLATQMANDNEMPTIMRNIAALAALGEHRHIVK
jgi:hypothetical protein